LNEQKHCGNIRALEKESLSEYFGGNFVATISGKAAITRALQHYNLQKEDNV
jgi:hypothetical protein